MSLQVVFQEGLAAELFPSSGGLGLPPSSVHTIGPLVGCTAYSRAERRYGLSLVAPRQSGLCPHPWATRVHVGGHDGAPLSFLIILPQAGQSPAKGLKTLGPFQSSF